MSIGLTWNYKLSPSKYDPWEVTQWVQRVRRDIADDWVLQHNNAPPHIALSIREFLVKKHIPILPHPPYSPDLAPCDFYLFPKLKSKLKGHHFGTMENIHKIVTDELNTLVLRCSWTAQVHTKFCENLVKILQAYKFSFLGRNVG